MMANNTLETYADVHGFLTKSDIIYGIVNKYYFSTSVVNSPRVKVATINLFIANFDDNVSVEATINEFVGANKETLQLTSARFNKNRVTIITKITPSLENDSFYDLLKIITEFCKEYSFVPSSALSNERDNLQFIYTKGNILVVSAQELQEKSDTVQIDDKSSYAKGTVGAVIGGVIGMIPWVLFSIIGLVSAISGLAMGWLTNKGYEIANGKKGSSKLIILVAVIVIFTYLGIIAGESYFLIQVLTEDGTGISEIRMMELAKFMITLPFTNGIAAAEMRGAILQGYLFAALGSISIFTHLKKEKEGWTKEEIDIYIPQPSTMDML